MTSNTHRVFQKTGPDLFIFHPQDAERGKKGWLTNNPVLEVDKVKKKLRITHWREYTLSK
jgi:hypothetical protein